MKSKLFTIALFVSLLTQAQNLQLAAPANVNPVRNFPPSTNQNIAASISDTLHYFYNKHFFRNNWTGNQSTSPNLLFYTIPNPYPSQTFTISHCGSIFYNTANVSITGVEGIVIKQASAPTASVPVKFYVCNVNSSNFPIFPPLDSVVTTISNSTSGDWIGANFTNPVTVTGKFAVLFRVASSSPLDTVRLFMNNASAATSTVPSNQRYGENMGVMRINGNFQLTATAFGGSAPDYEFIVAPRVAINYTAGATANSATLCTNSFGTFSNTTNFQAILDNRQFNFNKFYSYWSPWSTSTNSLITNRQIDSIYRWNFTGSTTSTLYAKQGNALFNTTGVQTASLAVFYKPSATTGIYPSIVSDATAQINVSASFAPSITVTGNSVICTGFSTTLSATGNPTYTWTTPPTTAASVIVSPSVTTIYTVQGADPSGCIGAKLFTVVVTPQPTVAVSGPTSVCTGLSYTLTASGADSYSWTNGSTNTNLGLTGGAPGTETIGITGTSGNCPPSNSVISVVVKPLPQVAVTSTSTFMCTRTSGGETVALSGSPTGGKYSGVGVNSAGIYNPINAGTTTAVYTYTDPTTSCINSSSVSLRVVDCTGISDNSQHELTIFPNPANDFVVVSGVTIGHSIEVYSASGALVQRLVATNTEETVRMTNLPDGIYLLQVHTNNGLKALKVVHTH